MSLEGQKHTNLSICNFENTSHSSFFRLLRVSRISVNILPFRRNCSDIAPYWFIQRRNTRIHNYQSHENCFSSNIKCQRGLVLEFCRQGGYPLSLKFSTQRNISGPGTLIFRIHLGARTSAYIEFGQLGMAVFYCCASIRQKVVHHTLKEKLSFYTP